MLESILLVAGIAAWRALWAMLAKPSKPSLETGIYISASYKQRKARALQDYLDRLAVRQR